ncbi:MAG: bifunctional nuclease family protein [Propionibacteriaceae bacterium]|nr:bifunctional nuclease family protein [Propionibacteriaceae bacterium]
MRELRVEEVRVSTPDMAPLVILAEVEGDRVLPIWMSATGAAAIVGATDDPDPYRPGIHDLVSDVVDTLGGTLQEVQIVAYDDGQFFAEVVVQGVPLAARPSDAIALALRTGCPIRCADDVLDTAGVHLNPPGVADRPEAPPEDQVQRFREFLDNVSPDDF